MNRVRMGLCTNQAHCYYSAATTAVLPYVCHPCGRACTLSVLCTLSRTVHSRHAPCPDKSRSAKVHHLQVCSIKTERNHTCMTQGTLLDCERFTKRDRFACFSWSSKVMNSAAMRSKPALCGSQWRKPCSYPRIPFLAARQRRDCCSMRTAALSPDQLFNTATAAMVPVYGILLACPKSWVVYRVVTSHAVPFVLCAGWMAAVGVAASDISQVPQVVQTATGAMHSGMAAISKVFMEKWFTAIAWLNLLMLDFLMAREIALDAVDRGIVSAHSVILCFMCGPLGYLSHLLTKAIFVPKADAA
eukprot:jgi/Ulvmu1/812/UM010_0186.1